MSIQSMLRSFACVGVVVLLAGCSKQESAGPVVELNLPPKPDLHAKQIPEKYDDGTLTVTGVVKNAAQLNNNQVKVRGKVVKIETCAVGEVCTGEAAVTLTDDDPKSTRTLAVMDPSEGLYHDLAKEFQVGALVTVEGKLSTWSPTGRTINMDGILLLDKPKAPECAEGPEGDECRKAAEAAKTAEAAKSK
ncbi:MAG TPA: hypothetical protein PLB35_12355 [Myxococcota bacterium]|nr:hypothetical protein [Myxococcota bacterium]HNZ03171.1 hypothetical protein [Myxococcota bacterium]HOH78033.1 hypothetical protein [Myxococcota bacterium]